jgi:hypothetical protein
VRLATETDRESVSTKVVTNHNKAHALTVQYWEVLRQFQRHDRDRGCEPGVLRADGPCAFPAGRSAAGADRSHGASTPRPSCCCAIRWCTATPTRSSPTCRVAHREGPAHPGGLSPPIRAPRSTCAARRPTCWRSRCAARFIPYERCGCRSWCAAAGGSCRSRSTRRLPRSRRARLRHARRFRRRAQAPAQRGRRAVDDRLAGDPESIDKSEIVGFEIRRAFVTSTTSSTPAKNPLFDLLKAAPGRRARWPAGDQPGGRSRPSVRIEPGELERELAARRCTTSAPR